MTMPSPSSYGRGPNQPSPGRISIQVLLAMLFGLLFLGIVVTDFTINPLTADIPTDEATKTATIEPTEESTAEPTSEPTKEPTDGSADGSSTTEPTAEITVTAGETAAETSTAEPPPEISNTSASTPTIRFDSTDYIVNEQAEEVLITVRLEGTPAPDNPASVDFIIENSEGEIITRKPLVLEQPLLTLNESFEDNEIPESDKEWHLQLVEPKNAKLGDKREATLTILDDDATIGFSESVLSPIDEARQSIDIKVTLNGQSRQNITVDYGVDGKSKATKDEDYSFDIDEHTLVFEPGGDKEKQFTVNIKDNNNLGDTEIILILRNPVGAKLDTSRDTLRLKIKDDDGGSN
jgi:hypothetical protein